MNTVDRLQVTQRQEGLAFSYDILWHRSFDALAEAVQQLPIHPRRICIVSDSHVAALYLEEVQAALAKTGCEITSFVFPAGEEQKNLQTVQQLYAALIAQHFDRKDLLAALGGGVTGDLTGFAAATYLRGIDFIQIPTSLLAQVDSSVGGKTGVDFENFKNMVGAFHQPRLVYMNMQTLNTLDDAQFASGMGEVLKSAEIRDAALLDWIEANADKISARDADALAHVVRACCAIKAAVVAEDPTEQGVRAILNFGHTLGHAIEKVRSFALLHGQCVALGSIGAAWICVQRGLLDAHTLERLEKLHEHFQLPSRVQGVTPEQVIAATRADKKMSAGHIRFILLNGIGSAFIAADVSDAEMTDAVRYLLQED